MLVTLSEPLGLGALSLQSAPLPVALYLQVSGVGRVFVGGWGWAGWGVITHACEAKASEGNEV